MKKALYRIQNPKLKISQYAPAYVKILHMAQDPDERNLLDNKITKRIQSILGTMLYYAWLVDSKHL